MKIRVLRTLAILLCILLFSADLFGSERATAQGPRSTPTPSSLRSIPTPTRAQNPNTRRSPATYVSPSWERSHESDAVLCDAVGGCLEAGLGLLTYPDNVWDNGAYYPNSPSVPGIQWASWRQINTGDIRRFKATFTFPDNLDPNSTQGIIFDPYYDVDIIPINDNIYIFVNGTQVYTGGTSYNAINGETGGYPSRTTETDDWYVSAPIISIGFRSGINTIDVLTEERFLWGGLGYLMLRFSPRESLYAISGRVTYDNGAGASGVTITSSSGSSALTDASGNYTLTNVITGTYTITPTKSGNIFAPITHTVSVPPDATGKDFKIRTTPPSDFLDIPVTYSNFANALTGNTGGNTAWLVNSW